MNGRCPINLLVFKCGWGAVCPVTFAMHSAAALEKPCVVVASGCEPGGGRKKTGPNSADRRKPGSNHHILIDAHGIPLNVLLTRANRYDVTQLLPLVDSAPLFGGKPRHPRQHPDSIYGDRVYDSELHRKELRERGIEPFLAKRNTEHGSGLGVYRWVAERDGELVSPISTTPRSI